MPDLKIFDTTEVWVGERIFYLSPFGAFQAARIQVELIQLAAPFLGAAGVLFKDEEQGNKQDAEQEEVQPDEKQEEVQLDKFMPLLTDALSTLTPDRFEKLIRTLLLQKNVAADLDGKVQHLTYDHINNMFAGNVHEMYLLIYEVFKVNYGDFFAWLSNQFGDHLGGVTKRLSSDTEN